jgi:hypothetical protein
LDNHGGAEAAGYTDLRTRYPSDNLYIPRAAYDNNITSNTTNFSFHSATHPYIYSCCTDPLAPDLISRSSGYGSRLDSSFNPDFTH